MDIHVEFFRTPIKIANTKTYIARKTITDVKYDLHVPVSIVLHVSRGLKELFFFLNTGVHCY